MDLERVKAHARIKTGRSWPAQPLRSLFWRLMKPYFQAFADEFEERLVRLERHVELACGSADSPERGGLALEFDGLRKDVKAIAHRLAGLEEEVSDGGGIVRS